jgi:hypothetical protein
MMHCDRLRVERREGVQLLLSVISSVLLHKVDRRLGVFLRRGERA